jgi:hypothetical protein
MLLLRDWAVLSFIEYKRGYQKSFCFVEVAEIMSCFCLSLDYAHGDKVPWSAFCSLAFVKRLFDAS